MNAWKPRGLPSLRICFRPLSLKRSKDDLKSLRGVIEVAPKFRTDDVFVRVDDEPVDMLENLKLRKGGKGCLFWKKPD